MYYYRYVNAEVNCCYKYIMFTYNIVFWLAGLLLIAAGIWAWSEKGVLQNLSQLTQRSGFDPVWLVLLVGGVSFTLGFAGCVGALRENICLLKFFSGLICFIIFLELGVAVLAVLFQSQLRNWLSDFLLANIKAYETDDDLKNLIDSLQQTRSCCGAEGPKDWDQNPYYGCDKPSLKCGVPFSCCVVDPADSVLNTQCGYGVRKLLESEWAEHIYMKGCMAALEDWLPGNLYTLAGAFLVISLLQIVGIYLAKSLISDIQKVRLTY
uniref:tetraspanin-14 isoform X1 n=1 Tax=Doryrhamphus excisus TaxID=161450 RepID=UPI0025AE176C|nr:tetraspanin-14 isoform X1 [Doryrhamphus excisus]XP_057914852.1 tetraspanin-14 isoform X1 [Doryrhamphus excisus]XP_057914859.1 tetraspanin-14 isoform X1 [Doryrhamphus excisus]XP_057914868.1 tetraspanin-14 isoform X2 [Doryrhamphus excisus]XP_057914878.1 tetraspanin-14 isoform X1 [Doryrhamphus excisus]